MNRYHNNYVFPCMAAATIAFGPFCFEPTACVLSKNGAVVALQSQPARVLAMLTARAGEIVTRPCHLQTLPHRGYRFIAPVTEVAQAPSPLLERVADMRRLG
jgi:DNA-binding winged helix-turn-helix (wHTH) protein